MQMENVSDATQRQCRCVKEPVGSIPIARIIDKLDSLFAKDDNEEAKRVLEFWESEARALNDKRGLCEILSEEIGFYRRTGDSQKGLAAVENALSILDCIDDGDSVANATIYLNCATTMKAFGKAEEALRYYDKARLVYDRMLPADDYRFAGLYNNFATALGDLGRFNEAREHYLKAIGILQSKGGFGEVAVSYVNLAQLAYDEAQIAGRDCEDEVEGYLNAAYDCLDDTTLERDANYASICAKCAQAFGFFGYFMQKNELEKRAAQIYGK